MSPKSFIQLQQVSARLIEIPQDSGNRQKSQYLFEHRILILHFWLKDFLSILKSQSVLAHLANVVTSLFISPQTSIHAFIIT